MGYNILGVVSVIFGCVAAIALSFNGMPDEAFGCFFVGVISGIMVNVIGGTDEEQRYEL